MLTMKNLIKSAVHRAGITAQVSSVQIVTAIRVFLDASVIPVLRPSIQVISYQHGSLKILCANAVAAHEVRSLESGIRDALVRTDPKAELRHLFIQIGTPKTYEL